MQRWWWDFVGEDGEVAWVNLWRVPHQSGDEIEGSKLASGKERAIHCYLLFLVSYVFPSILYFVSNSKSSNSYIM